MLQSSFRKMQSRLPVLSALERGIGDGECASPEDLNLSKILIKDMSGDLGMELLFHWLVHQPHLIFPDADETARSRQFVPGRLLLSKGRPLPRTICH